MLVSASALFIIWLGFRLPFLVAGQNGLIRFVLPLVFSLLILLRHKPHGTAKGGEAGGEINGHLYPTLAAAAGVLGTTFALTGLILSVHQFEWLGLLLILGGCLLWALPRAFHRDILLALFLLYWAHPLPSSLFGFLQLSMQRMSVSGSEWLLHMLNVRTWADGFLLYTPFNVYEVPEWCSGMRTATTVFLLALGLGILRRQAWLPCLGLAMAALAQALALNVIRISVLVALVPGGTQNGPGVAFLHDTGGVIVLAAIVLVYAELVMWERWKRRQALLRNDLNPDLMKILTENPPVVAFTVRHKGVILSSVLLLMLAAGLVYKSRPAHRAEMIKDVVAGLRDSGKLEQALRAAEEVRRLQPGDAEWELTMIRILLLQGRYGAVLADLPRVSDAGGRANEKRIIQAYALMGLNQIDKAVELVRQIVDPADGAPDPRLAMVLAELGFYANNVDEVTRHVVYATRWPPNARRIRSLFPYLRLYNKWDTITRCDMAAPYTDPVPAFCAAEAFMNVGDTPKVANLALQAMQTWPDDPRVLEPLFFLAIRRGDSDWEPRFAAHLARSIGTQTNPDALYRLADKCFQLVRPDLAWIVLNRLARLDPTHPALAMSAARYGDAWFSFRKRHLGITSPRETDTLDLRTFYRFGRTLTAWRPSCERVPFGEELSGQDTAPSRKALLDTALAEFKKRDREGRLSGSMEYEYVKALEMASRIGEAKVQLASISTRIPAATNATVAVLSEVFERRGDWQNVYETLRTYPDQFDKPRTSIESSAQLAPLLRLCQAQMNLHMGLAALHTAREAVRLFPRATQAAHMLAAALAEFDSPEEALLVLGHAPDRRHRDQDLLEAQCLYRTERFVEMQSFCRATTLPPPAVTEETPQALLLPPAEMAVLWQRISIPTEREFDDTATRLRLNLERTASPFLRKLIPLWLDCHARRGGGDTADPAAWTACGRDRIEKATALSQLTLHLCRQKRYADARNSTDAAVKLLPDSAILWRILIGLSGADPDVIAAARRSCPGDSEIWLADIVRAQRSEVRDQKSAEEWFEEEIRQAVEAGTFTPAAMTRAGEYLYRRGMQRAASLAARDAVARARGLVPAHVLGIKCALVEQDKAWALECTRNAVMATLKPPALFFKKLVELKAGEEDIVMDPDMIRALKALRAQDPANPIWAQMLGYVRFKRGGWEMVDAMSQMTAALDAGSTNRSPYIIAAEASRLVGNSERAADFLRQGLRLYPGDLAMLNNLVYTLAETTNGVIEAADLAPELERRAKEDPQLLDTLTVFYLRSGQLDKSEAAIASILSRVEKRSALWFRANLHQADILAQRGKLEEAASALRGILNSSRGIPDTDVLDANKLQAAVKARIAERRIPD